MYSIEELNKVHWMKITQAHIDALGSLVLPVLAGVPEGKTITTSELLRRLGLPLGGQAVVNMLKAVRAANPRCWRVDPSRTFMKHPCYLWHASRLLTQEEKIAIVQAAATTQQSVAKPGEVQNAIGETPRERAERLAALIPENDDLSDLTRETNGS